MNISRDHHFLRVQRKQHCFLFINEHNELVMFLCWLFLKNIWTRRQHLKLKYNYESISIRDNHDLFKSQIKTQRCGGYITRSFNPTQLWHAKIKLLSCVLKNKIKMTAGQLRPSKPQSIHVYELNDIFFVEEYFLGTVAPWLSLFSVTPVPLLGVPQKLRKIGRG